jgi:hypothetical protein
MAQAQYAARSLNDLGLAAWFGGSLMGAVGLNQGAARAVKPGEAATAAGAGWARWTPVQLGAIGAHLVGGTALAFGNKTRVGAQRGVATTAVIKTALTAAALAATAYARVIGQRVIRSDEPATSGTGPTPDTAPDVAGAQRQLRVLQWVIPALTGGMIVCDAVLGEQQRPTSVASGVLGRFARR